MIRRKVCEVPSVASVILRPSMYLSIGMGLNRGNNCMDGLHFVKRDDVTFGFARPAMSPILSLNYIQDTLTLESVPLAHELVPNIPLN